MQPEMSEVYGPFELTQPTVITDPLVVSHDPRETIRALMWHGMDVETFIASRTNGNSVKKLNHGAAMHIRRLHSTGRYTQVALARLYGVSEPAISRIVNEHAYRSVAS